MTFEGARDVDDIFALSAQEGGLRASEKQYLLALRPAQRRKFGALMRVTMRNKRAPLRFRVLKSSLPAAVKAQLFSDIGTDDSDKLKAYAESLLKIPFGVYTQPPAWMAAEKASALHRCAHVMNAAIVGNSAIKHRVLSMYTQWLHGGNTAFAFALEGPPGIGKTTFVKQALAAAFERPMTFVNLGGASDAATLSGHGYTYEGAKYGRLAGALMEAKVMDPIIYFDELDKVSSCARGEDIFNTLVHLTDPAQNTHIRDRYFHGVDLDFSKCILVFSYNDPSRVSPILLDRLERLQMLPPTGEEKMRVIREQMLPRALRRLGDMELAVDDGALSAIADHHRDEAGMRGINKSIEGVVAAAAMCRALGSGSAVGLQNAPVSMDAAFARHILARQAPSSHAAPTSMYM